MPISKLDRQTLGILGLLDPEYPSPSGVARNDTTQNGTQDASNRNDHPDHARHPLSHIRCADLIEYYESQRIQARTTNTLSSPASNQCFDGMGKATSDRQGKEDGESGNVGIPMTDDVANTCEERGASKVGE